MLSSGDGDRGSIVAACFRERYGASPELWTRAPGRVDLMGSHTDYNLGFVLTLPIDRDAWAAVRRRADDTVRVFSMNLGEQDEFRVSAIERVPESRWRNYPRAVAITLRDAGLPVSGCDMVVHSTTPLESGLSSSAALECAVATVFEALGGWRLTPERKALLCQRAENEFAGVRCGILDQYSSCLGQGDCALLLDCRDLSTRAVRMAAGVRVVICNTMSERRLTGGEYAQRRSDCERGAELLGLAALRDATSSMLEQRCGELPAEVARRSQFIVEENARVSALALALEAGDRDRVARLCEESFVGARDLYEICSPPMLDMHAAMCASPGVIGGRQAGAGFGGCMVAFVEEARIADFEAFVKDAYAAASGRTPEVPGTGGARGVRISTGDLMRYPLLDQGMTPCAADIAAFQRDGHVLLRGVASMEEVSVYREAILAARDQYGADRTPLETRDAYGRAFLKGINLWTSDEAVKRFVLAPRFGRIASLLLGVDGVRVYHDQALLKEPGGGITPWHQDQHYWPLDTVNTITMWMPLVDVTPEMGSMRFASGSHRDGYLGDMPISEESEQRFDSYIRDRGYEVPEPAAMRAGDATFHYGWTLHGAPGNATDRTREVMTIIWFEDGTRVSEPDNSNRRRDLERWLPGLKPGDVAASVLNPLVYRR